MEFLYSLRAVKSFFIKVCKDVFCITPMLTALKQFFTASSPLQEAILEYFLVWFEVFVLYFLITVWFLVKSCTYILDNTLMVFRLEDFMGRGCCTLLGAIFRFVF